MKNLRLLIILICMALVLTSCKPVEKNTLSKNMNEEEGKAENWNKSLKRQDLNKEAQEIDEPAKDQEADKEERDLIAEKISSMSLDAKIGQLIIAGFQGEEISQGVRSLIVEGKVGGLILFARNIKSAQTTRELLNDLKKANSVNEYPLFLSIDEEGGRVSRLPSDYKKLPKAMDLAAKDDLDLSYELGELLAMRVASLGFNLNFAPVLDIYSNPKNKVIGTRAFGKNPEDVQAHGLRVMEAIRDQTIIPAVKHFPGHGDTLLDSHLDLPTVDKSLDQLKAFELKPFQAAIYKEVPMIMIAHILYPKLDKYKPASMSYTIITELLRDSMSYEGLIVSDDMTMAAIANNYTVEDASLEFLKAGGDLALICHQEINVVNTIERIKKALDEGEISIEDLDEKVYRILRVKEEYDLEDRIIEELDLEILNNKTEEFLNNFK